MQVSPINNTNFQGKFKKNPVLEKLLVVSDIETLVRFNEVLNRATKIQDGYVYKITCEKLNNPLSHTELLSFSLKREDTKHQYETIEKKIETSVDSHDTISQKMDKCSGILKRFLPKLESDYPRTDFDASHAELREKILNKLI